MIRKVQPETADWTPRQERAATLLASGRGARAAAKEVKIGERTLYDWLEQPGYRELIAKLRGQMVADAVGTLSEACGQAAATLQSLLTDESAGIRLQASQAILSQLRALREHTELAERISRLEALATEEQQRPTKRGYKL